MKSNLVINQSHKKIVKAIIQNLKNSSELKSVFESAFNSYDGDEINAVRIIRENPQAKALFNEHVAEFYSWRDSFLQVVAESDRRAQLERFSIDDKLIQIQHKIKPKNTHSSYVLSLMTLVKKDLKFDDIFLTKWRDKKNAVKQQKMQKVTTNKPDNETDNQQKSSEQTKQPRALETVNEQKVVPPAPSQTPQQKERERNLMIQKQRQNKKQSERKAEMESIKRTYQGKFMKNRQTRFFNMLKYLDTRRQFNISNKQAVAKQIINNLEKFMKIKVQKILQIAKVRLPGYDSQEVGDEFRIYSSKSNIFAAKHVAMIPESDLRFLKVRYPSKLQKYLNLRVQEQRQQQKLRIDVKQKLQMDKKSEKFVQQYVTAEHTEGGHEYENDEGPKRRDRLLIAPQVIQFVIESDSWFGDQHIMEKTYYRSSV